MKIGFRDEYTMWIGFRDSVPHSPLSWTKDGLLGRPFSFMLVLKSDNKIMVVWLRPVFISKIRSLRFSKGFQ